MVVRPLGERSRTSSSGRIRRTPRRSSTPSTSNSARQRRAGPRHSTSAIVPRSAMCAGPAGTSVTGRTMPFQFHQPSGSFGFFRPSAITTSSFRRLGRRPRAGTVNGVYGSTLRPTRRPLRITAALRRTLSKRSSQLKPRGVGGPRKLTR
jgi:hypothetical protein